MVARLHSLVAGEVTGMVAAAGTARDLIGTDAAAAAALAGQIERDGRQALARLREILGLLRSEYDPAPLSPGLGVEHIEDLIARSAQEPARTLARLDVSGVPVPLPEGVDLVAYRVVAEVLAAGACTAVGIRFGERRLCLDFALTGRAEAPGAAVRDDIGRVGGAIHAAATGTGERITVELPLGLVAAGP